MLLASEEKAGEGERKKGSNINMFEKSVCNSIAQLLNSEFKLEHV